MARTITLRGQIEMFPVPEQPAVAPQFMALWEQPQGLDYVTPINSFTPNKARSSNNLRVTSAGKYIVRPGLTVVGGVAGDTQLGVVVASKDTGVEYTVRITSTGVEVSTGSTWQSYSGPTLDIPESARPEFAAWNNKLLFTDQTSGLYEIDFSAKTYSLISAAPVGKHLTVFGGRVVLSNIVNYPTRVQWCVKNDNTDWSGIGSGYDDMLSAPGGVVDIQHGVYPITDTEAYVVRASSIWAMSLTGIADSPYEFAFRFAQGTDSPKSIVRLPGQGIIMLGRDDVYMVNPSGLEQLGIGIRDQLLGSDRKPQNAVGVLDTYNMLYMLYVPASSTETTSTVYNYHWLSKSWHKDTYPFVIKDMAAGNNKTYLTISELTGSIAELTGAVGDLGVSGRRRGVIFAATDGYIRREDDDSTTDAVSTPVPCEITSGFIQPGGPLKSAGLVQAILAYTSERAITLTASVSSDGGTTWATYGSFTLQATSIPRLVPIHKAITYPQFQVRITGTDAVGMSLLGLYLYGTEGALVHI